MSVSGIDSDPFNFGDISEVTDTGEELIDNCDFGLEIISQPSGTPFKVERRAFVIGLVAGVVVMAIALTVAVIAVTMLTGVPQTVLLGISLACLTAGGVTIVRHIVNLIKLKRKEYAANQKNSETRAFKFAAAVGSGLMVLGMALRLGASFISSPVAKLVNNLGTSTEKLGVSSLFIALGGLLYSSINRKFPVQNEALDDVTRDKRIVTGAAIALTIGVGLAAVGVAMLIIGTSMIGVPQVLLLTFAAPLISVGVGLILRVLLGFPLQELKNILKSSREKSPIDVDSSNQEAEGEVSEIVNKMEVKEVFEPDSSVVLEEAKTDKSGKSRILDTNQTVILVLSSILFIAAIALIVLSGTLGLGGFQVVLLSMFGGSMLAASLPLILTGMVKIAAKLKMRGIESRMRRRGPFYILDDEVISYKKLERLDIKTLKRVKIIDPDKWAELNKRKEEQAVHQMGVVIGAISVLIGIATILLPLIPALAPISAVLLAIGTPFVVVGVFLSISSLVDDFKEKLLRIYNKRRIARERLRHILNQVDSHIEDIETDLTLSTESYKVA